MPAPVTRAMACRRAERDQPQHRLDRQRSGWPLMRMGPPVSSPSRAGFSARYDAVQHEERDDGEDGEDDGLEVQRLPEHVGEAERVEPQRLDVIGERRSAAEERGAASTTSSSRRPRRRGCAAAASRLCRLTSRLKPVDVHVQVVIDAHAGDAGRVNRSTRLRARPRCR